MKDDLIVEKREGGAVMLNACIHTGVITRGGHSHADSSPTKYGTRYPGAVERHKKCYLFL